jgi:FKBP-type peptidyl-prolyl cis-trans isomerase FklB
MKPIRTVTALAVLPLLLLGTTDVRAAAAAAAAPAAAKAAPAASTMDDVTRMNYALGYQLGRDLATTEFKPEALVKGIQDSRSGAKSKLSDAEMEASLNALQKNINDLRAKEQAETAKKAAVAGASYLLENAKRPGVTTTANGVQYKVLTAGTGRKPIATDTVTANYRGTLVDGTEFDSTYKRGKSATFPVTAGGAGLAEALQLMSEGAKYQVAIPSSLAYGDRGALANQVLLFEIELVSVQPPAAPAK